MPDTKIKKTQQGWIDTDRPNQFHRVRRLARDARRIALAKQPMKGIAPQNAPFLPNNMNTNVVQVGYQPGPGQGTAVAQFVGLQKKLWDRLTMHQGVSPDDALEIITNNSYNKAASYGHMRAAGANHHEAKIVISLNSPDTSLAYGIARAQGMNHVDSLSKALKT